MPTPKLWSKLEDAGDVTSPDLGTGGSEVGSPTYVAAKFNNGIFIDIDNEGCNFPCAANSINLDKGTIELWWKPNFTQADGDNHGIFSFQDVPTGGLLCYFDEYSDDITVSLWANSGYKFSIITAGLTWSANDLIHLGVTWDCTGADIGSGRTCALYVDDVLKASTTTTWNAGSGHNANLYIGSNVSSAMHADAVLDNLKTYDTCKVDFSDKDTEGVGEEEAEATIFFSHNF